ncbi:hypothetical protein BpHYR1_009187, partial [Brachionus plicatilis]
MISLILGVWRSLKNHEGLITPGRWTRCPLEYFQASRLFLNWFTVETLITGSVGRCLDGETPLVRSNALGWPRLGKRAAMRGRNHLLSKQKTKHSPNIIQTLSKHHPSIIQNAQAHVYIGTQGPNTFHASQPHLTSEPAMSSTSGPPLGNPVAPAPPQYYQSQQMRYSSAMSAASPAPAQPAMLPMQQPPIAPAYQSMNSPMQ